MTATIEISYDHCENMFYEITVTDIDYRPGKPAKIDALPEDCYPAEYAEIVDYRIIKIVRSNDESIWTAEGKNLDLTDDIDEDRFMSLLMKHIEVYGIGD